MVVQNKLSYFIVELFSKVDDIVYFGRLFSLFLADPHRAELYHLENSIDEG